MRLNLLLRLGEQLKLDVELSHPNIPGCRFVKDEPTNTIRKDKRTRPRIRRHALHTRH